MPRVPRLTTGFSILAAAVLFLGVIVDAVAQQRPAPAGAQASPLPGDLTKLAEGVFVQIVSPDSDAVSNSGIVILDSGTLIFDTHYTLESGEALFEKTKVVSTHPVRYIVDSHFHPDHTHGNQAFPGIRQIIGSTNTRRDMFQKDQAGLNQMQAIAQSQLEQLNKDLRAEQDPKLQAADRAQINEVQALIRRMSAIRLLPPTMTFDESLILVDGPRELQFLFLGAAHTDGDIILFLPQEKIAFLADIFFHDAFPNVEDASMLEWMKTLRQVLSLDARTFVPGHGQPGSRTDVENFLNYLEDLKALVEPAVARGDSLEQAVRDLHIPAKYAGYAFTKFFPSNVQKIYAELKANQQASPASDTVKK